MEEPQYFYGSATKSLPKMYILYETSELRKSLWVRFVFSRKSICSVKNIVLVKINNCKTEKMINFDIYFIKIDSNDQKL